MKGRKREKIMAEKTEERKMNNETKRIKKNQKIGTI